MKQDIDIPVPALVAACWMARHRHDTPMAKGIEAVLHGAAEAAARAARPPHVAELWRLACDGHPTAVLPFQVDPVTAAAAVLETTRSPDPPFRLYSERSVIDLGYVEVSAHALRYVDRADIPPPRAPGVDFPPRGMPEIWLQRLQARDSQPPTALFAEDTGDRLRLRVGADIAPTWGDVFRKVNLQLIGVAGGTARSRRSLGALPVVLLEDDFLDIGLTSEQQLQIHAAHFAGSMLHLDDGKQAALFPVPSLEALAPAVRGRTTLPVGESDNLPLRRLVIGTPPELARALGRLHWWFNPGKDFPTFALDVDPPTSGPPTMPPSS